MKLFRFLTAVILLAMAALWLPQTAAAQDGQPAGPLSVTTAYPSQTIGVGEIITLPLKVFSSTSQIVQLELKDVPEGWTASFRGGGRVVTSVYVEQNGISNVDLRLEPPADVAPGVYKFKVVARGPNMIFEFPVELTVKEKLPPRLSFTADLPTIRGAADTVFRYAVTLKNDGDEEVLVNLVADAPSGFLLTFKSGGKEVTSLPVEAGGSKRIDVEAESISEQPAGAYPITVYAQGGDVDASIVLTAEVVGKPELSITAPGGRLSEDIYLGRDNPLKLIVRNTGTAPAVGVKLSSSSPAGWRVTLDPEQIIEVPAGGEVEVNATVHPADKAVAGDYVITFTARPSESSSKSAEFRVTVRTSTVWGIVGVALIAVAVGVVALAVMRFGRR